jgi:predicted chitinase
MTSMYGEDTTRVAKVMRFFGHEKSAEWYDRFFAKESIQKQMEAELNRGKTTDKNTEAKFKENVFKEWKKSGKRETFADYLKPRLKAFRDSKRGTRNAPTTEGSGVSAAPKASSTERDTNGRVILGSIVGIRNQIDVLSGVISGVADDVSDIKTLIMPRKIVVRGGPITDDWGRENNDATGKIRLAHYNPLAPAGSQFVESKNKRMKGVVYTHGSPTSKPIEEGFMASAIKQAAMQTAILTLKMEKRDRAKANVRQKFAYSDKKETYKTESPIDQLREEMNSNFEKVFGLLKKVKTGEDESIVDDVAKTVGAVGAAATVPALLRAIPWLVKRIPFVTAAYATIKTGEYVVKGFEEADMNNPEKSDNIVAQYLAKQSVFAKKLADKYNSKVGNTDKWKEREAKNAAAGYTRGGVGSSKGPSMDESIAHFDKEAKNPKNTDQQREANARARDTLVAQRMPLLDARTASIISTAIPSTSAPVPIPKPVAPSTETVSDIERDSDTWDTNYQPQPAPRKKGSKPAVGGTGVLTDIGRKGTADTTLKAELLKAMDIEGITGSHRSQLLAQAHHETAGFTRTSESLNYSPEALKATFSYYKNHPDEADQDGYAKVGKKIVRRANEENIANKAYGKRNGNTAFGDGWKYRGRGAFQLTGKGNYETYGEMIGVDLVKNPDLVLDPTIGAKVAVAYYKKNVVKAGISGEDTRGATRAINGSALKGLSERENVFAQIQREQNPAINSITPTTTIPAVLADNETRTLQASNSPATQSITVVSTPIVNNTRVNNTTGKRPAAKADVLSQDKSLNRVVSRDTTHPVYG